MSLRNPFRPHSSKKSVISRTAEREFEREVKKLEQLDDNVKSIYKDMKKYVDSNTVQSKQECKLVHELGNSHLYKDDAYVKSTVDHWTQSAQKLDGLTQELNGTLNKTVVDPMKKLSSVFPNVQNAAKKREQSLQEYNKCQAKVDKYEEKERTGQNIVKLDSSRKALKTAKEEYDVHNNALMEDMPTLYEGRTEYIEPSLKALIQSQVKYFTESHIIYTELSEKLSSDRQSHLTSQDFDDHVQQKLNDIKALSITVDY